MAIKILQAGDLQAWIDKLIATHEVFAPVEDEKASSFRQIKAGQMPALDIKTDVPAKGIIFRQVEKILSYETGEDGISIKAADEGRAQKVIFGIRPCDARSFELIDKVFFDPALPENQYIARRKQTALITVACEKACRTCFCTSVGGAPADKSGDVWMINLGERYMVETLSQVGENLMAVAENLFSGATPDSEAAAKRIADDLASLMPKIQITGPKALDNLFGDEAFWTALSEKCLSCGACTFLCPTCYCFDVRDEGSVKSGDRYRGWDSCMFFQYNRAAGGHNPREQHWKRMRQRMLHKFCYYVENTGAIGCVGCGRCIRSCPVSYDLREFLMGAGSAVAAAAGGFADELPGEDKAEPLACDVKPTDETTKTGVGTDG